MKTLRDRFNVLDTSELSDAEVQLLAGDILGVQDEVDPTYPYEWHWAEKELARRIGGQANLCSYVSCLVAGLRPKASS